MSQEPILLMIKRAGTLLGVGETQMNDLARKRAVPYVRIERGATTLFPAAYIGWLRQFLADHEQPRVTRELARLFGRTDFARAVQGASRHYFWEEFRDVESLPVDTVEMLFGLTTQPGARIIQRWERKKVFTLKDGAVPASQLSAACTWWDMDYLH